MRGVGGFALVGRGDQGRCETHRRVVQTQRNRGIHLRIPITDEQLEGDLYRPPYYHPGMDSPEIQYLMERRRALGGFVPERRADHAPIELPDPRTYEIAKRGSGKQRAATTMT